MYTVPVCDIVHNIVLTKKNQLLPVFNSIYVYKNHIIMCVWKTIMQKKKRVAKVVLVEQAGGKIIHLQKYSLTIVHSSTVAKQPKHRIKNATIPYPKVHIWWELKHLIPIFLNTHFIGNLFARKKSQLPKKNLLLENQLA